ncbi:hypothetical protein U6S96_12205, partial [Cutibacterium acnes]
MATPCRFEPGSGHHHRFDEPLAPGHSSMTSFRLRDPYFTYRHRRPIHALRICAAVAITYLIITLLPIPHGSWALVSTVM